MTDREKLVELLQDGDNPVCGWFPNNATMLQLADYLIANGVTFATDKNDGGKWIPVTERLPEKGGQYLVRRKICVTSTVDVMAFSKDARKIDKHDFRKNWKDVWYYYDSEYGFITSDNVTHWMPLPEPPEEGE